VRTTTGSGQLPISLPLLGAATTTIAGSGVLYFEPEATLRALVQTALGFGVLASLVLGIAIGRATRARGGIGLALVSTAVSAVSGGALGGVLVAVVAWIQRADGALPEVLAIAVLAGVLGAALGALLALVQALPFAAIGIAVGWVLPRR
jgi:hypothetical protein